MAQLIGTAGHVDHGKTTLIKALTGVDTDRLPEEKKRGLTIDIGFAAIDLPEVGRISIVDVPGHERFVANMLVGALGMDVVMLCVAADQGVMPQTVEHFSVVKLLPVEKLVVALTRADLADADTLELAQMQVVDLLEGTRFEGAAQVPVSAVSSLGIEELKSELVRLLKLRESVKAGKWYLPVDRVFSRPGHGTVVTGTLARGSLTIGGPCVVMPRGMKTRAKSIHSHGESSGEVLAGQRVALNLAGVDLDEVERGNVVCEAGACFATELFDARIEWVEKPKHGARVRVSVGADEVMAKVIHNDHDESLVQLRVERICVVAKDQPLIVRSYSPPHVLGGGRVLVPEARKRRKNALAGEMGAKGGSNMNQIIHSARFGILATEIARLMGSTVQGIGDEIERSKSDGEILGFAGLWFTVENFEAGTDRFLSALKEEHEKFPDKALLPREHVTKAAGVPWRDKPLDRMITLWTQKGLIRSNGTNIALAEHRPNLGARQRSLLDRVKVILDAGGVSVPGAHEVTLELKVPKQAVEEILKVGVDAGELLRVVEGIWYTESFLRGFEGEIREAFAGRRFSAVEFKDRFGTSRKYAIPLLEYFDSVGVTMRQGDVRVLV
jgi:selenocysteine-specific elongation factor